MRFLMSNVGWACSAALFCQFKNSNKTATQIWKLESIRSGANRTTGLQLVGASLDDSTPGFFQFLKYGK